MKRTGILLLTVFYFIVASGLAINVHYCGGKLKDISFTQKEGCCCGSKKQMKGCCDEKSIVCKIKDNQKTTEKATIPDISTKQISALYVLISFITYQPRTTLGLRPEDTPPPNLYSDPVFLLNRNFRI